MKSLAIKLALVAVVGIGAVWYHIQTVHTLTTELSDVRLELSTTENTLLKCEHKIEQINTDVKYDEERGKLYDESMKELLEILKRVKELEETSYDNIRDSYKGSTCQDAMEFLENNLKEFKW